MSDEEGKEGGSLRVRVTAHTYTQKVNIHTQTHTQISRHALTHTQIIRSAHTHTQTKLRTL